MGLSIWWMRRGCWTGALEGLLSIDLDIVRITDVWDLDYMYLILIILVITPALNYI